jgi:hypothetical protein
MNKATVLSMLAPLPADMAESITADILAENATYERACKIVDAALNVLVCDDEHKAAFFERHRDYVQQHGFDDDLLDVAWHVYCQRPHAGEQNAICWATVEALEV